MEGTEVRHEGDMVRSVPARACQARSYMHGLVLSCRAVRSMMCGFAWTDGRPIPSLGGVPSASANASVSRSSTSIRSSLISLRDEHEQRLARA